MLINGRMDPDSALGLQTLAELAATDPDPADFASVDEWMNVGDSAHHAHMRPLMKLGRRDADGVTVPGSVFGDGLSSSELGWASLRRITTPRASRDRAA